MDHVQVSVGEGVLRCGLRAGLNTGILCVVVGLRGPGSRLLPLGRFRSAYVISFVSWVISLAFFSGSCNLVEEVEPWAFFCLIRTR